MTLYHKKTIHANNLGYIIDELGNIFYKGKQLKFTNINQRYYTFSIRYEGKRSKVLVHKLQAYQKYGDKSFEKGIHVRHKDGNSKNNSYDNILLGTPHENYMDRSPEERRNHALKASNKMRRFTDEEVELIRNDKNNGFSYKKLCKKYNTSLSTLSYLFNKSQYYSKNTS